LEKLWAEGDSLGRTLRCKVFMPMPAKVVVSVVTGAATAEPLRSGDVTAELDGKSAALGSRLDQLDGALARVAAIKQAKEIDLRHHLLSQSRGVAAEFTSVYRCLAPFDCLVDGLKFAAGDLVDHTVVGHGSLYRLMTGRRFVMPMELDTTAAA
jgi:hypothetical protein